VPNARAPAAGVQQPPDAEQLLRRLEWTVIKRLDGLLQGHHRTLMRGTGLDLADLREYQLHDDVRHIDWNVTARLDTPHVRVFTEDREMSAWLLLDLSGSVDFGSGAQSKRQLLAEFVAVLARLLTRHGNRVGALLYGAGVEQVIAARASRAHVLQLLHAVMHRPARAAAQARGPPHPPALQRVRGVGLHQRARLGAAAGAAGRAPRGAGRAPARPAGARPARPGPADPA